MGGKAVSKVKSIMFNEIGDNRGKLIALESNINIPFDIKRVYYLFATKNGAERGFHAHIELKQMAICLSGSCTMDVEYIQGKESYTLDSPSKGLLMEGIVWREIRDFSDDCVLIVLADALYSEDDYIRKYDKFEQSLLSIKSSLEMEA
jgi:dTDP-4-dehydrorhamnose 3,5-epimerase-like enzyme